MSPRQAGEPGRIWIVSPIYFDVPSWLVVRDRLDHALDSNPAYAGLERRFTLLDDSVGADPAIDELRNLEGVRVLTPPHNLGNQKAIVYALRELLPEFADEDLVVTMDADGEDSPEDVPSLLDGLGVSSSDPMRVVLAKRAGRRRGVFTMQAFYPVYRVLFALLTGVTAATGNFASYRGSTAKSMMVLPRFDRVYSASLISSNDLARTLVPCRKGERVEGRPKIGFRQHCRHAVAMLEPFSRRILRRALVLIVALALAALLILLISDRSSAAAAPAGKAESGHWRRLANR